MSIHRDIRPNLTELRLNITPIKRRVRTPEQTVADATTKARRALALAEEALADLNPGVINHLNNKDKPGVLNLRDRLDSAITHLQASSGPQES